MSSTIIFIIKNISLLLGHQKPRKFSPYIYVCIYMYVYIYMYTRIYFLLPRTDSFIE